MLRFALRLFHSGRFDETCSYFAFSLLSAPLRGRVSHVQQCRLAPSVGYASRSLDSRRSDLVAGSLLAAEAGLLFLLFFPKPQMLPTPLATENGSFLHQIRRRDSIFTNHFLHEDTYAERKRHSDIAGTAGACMFSLGWRLPADGIR